jgi:hypothetical protein
MANKNIIKFLNEAPINFSKMDEVLGFHQGTTYKISKGILKGKKQTPAIIEHIKKLTKWMN